MYTTWDGLAKGEAEELAGVDRAGDGVGSTGVGAGAGAETGAGGGAGVWTAFCLDLFVPGTVSSTIRSSSSSSLSRVITLSTER